MATGHRRQLAIKNHDPNDPNDPMAADRSAGWRHGRWHAAGWPRVGPAAKGRQKRTDREQFFFSYKIFFLVE